MAQNGRPRRVISFNNIGALNFMSGLRARSACVAMMLAAFTPLLAGCDESSSAISAAQPNDPDVSIVIVKPQPRAVVRELPGRIAPARGVAGAARPHCADARLRRAAARLRHRGRAPVPTGQRGEGR